MEQFEEQLHQDLHQFLQSMKEVDERLPECPDVEDKWEEIAKAYIPDGIREFNDFPSASLGWMMYIGMAVAKFWDAEWEIYSKIEDLYAYMRDKRGYDAMDEYIREDVLLLQGVDYTALEKVTGECASRVYNAKNVITEKSEFSGMITIRKYRVQDIVPAMEIWNEVVRDGIAFPQDEELTEQNADSFFNNQSYTGIAEDNSTGELVGLYILHPNNVGRCGHICNTSYAVKKGMRGLHIGEQLVKDSLKVGVELGFRILQFNAVVATNSHALHLYERLGFTQLGKIPQGFRMKDGHYEDIIPHYILLK